MENNDGKFSWKDVPENNKESFKEWLGISASGGGEYTLSEGWAKGVLFLDGKGNEIGRYYFKNNKNAQNFKVPKECEYIKFVKPK